jgi:hypothetical protein
MLASPTNSRFLDDPSTNICTRFSSNRTPKWIPQPHFAIKTQFTLLQPQTTSKPLQTRSRRQSPLPLSFISTEMKLFANVSALRNAIELPSSLTTEAHFHLNHTEQKPSLENQSLHQGASPPSLSRCSFILKKHDAIQKYISIIGLLDIAICNKIPPILPHPLQTLTFTSTTSNPRITLSESILLMNTHLPF